MNKSAIITLIVLILTAVLIVYILQKDNNNVDENLVKCIAGKSTLYVAKGCAACEAQKAIFGTTFSYLKTIDCAVTPEDCEIIINNGYISTPTWIIDEQKIVGVQTIEQLKQLTGC